MNCALSIAGVVLICLVGVSECSGQNYLSKLDTLNAILEGQKQVYVEDDPNTGSGFAVDQDKLNILLHAAKDKFQSLNATDQERITMGVKTLGVFLETAYQSWQTNGLDTGCNGCMTLVRFLKLCTIFFTVDETVGVAYNICVKYGPKVDPGLATMPNQIEEFCNVVWLQGPDFYFVIGHLEITTLVQCEYLNACMPPPSNDTSVNTGGRTLPPFIHDHLSNPPEHPIFPLSTKSPHTPRSLRRKRSAPPADAIKVGFLTDVHVDLFYEQNTFVDCGMPVCCNADDGNGTAGPWGEYQCSTPYQTYVLFLNKLKSLNPDFLLYGGDNPPAKVWSGTEQGHLNCTYAIVNGIKTVLPGLPAYPNVGNHEAFPTNLYYTGLNATQELNMLSTQWWGPLANFNEDNKRTMNEWFYYAKEIKPGLILLSFNSLYMYTLNWYISLENSAFLYKNNNVMKMQQFMVDTMENATMNKQKVLLMGHVPAGNGAVMPGRWLTNFVLKYSDLIVLYVAGHTHQDDFRLIIDQTTGVAKGVNLVAPSIDTRNFRNPGMRMFYLDPNTYQALDFEQYYLNLPAALGPEDPTIDLEYQATVEYDIPDLSPASYLDLALRMNTDQTLFETFVRNYYTQVTVTSDSNDACTSAACRNQWLCRVTNSNYDQRKTCTTEQYFLQPASTPAPTQPPCVATGATFRGAPVMMTATMLLLALTEML